MNWVPPKVAAKLEHLSNKPCPGWSVWKSPNCKLPP